MDKNFTHGLTRVNPKVKLSSQRVRKGLWELLAVGTPRGECPLFEFLGNLEGNLAKDALRVLKLLDRVADQGPPRNTEISHELEDGIWEFIQGRLRILWFYDVGKLIICSHGFVKKSQKTPRSEIRRAQLHRKIYLRAQRRGRIWKRG